MIDRILLPFAVVLVSASLALGCGGGDGEPFTPAASGDAEPSSIVSHPSEAGYAHSWCEAHPSDGACLDAGGDAVAE